MLEASTNAVKHIGTNALPFLLKRILVKKRVLDQRLQFWTNIPSWLPFRFRHPIEGVELGFEGFKLLGNDAMSAMPALVQLTRHPDEEIRCDGLAILNCINLKPETFLPILVEGLHDPANSVQRLSAYILSQSYPEAAEKAGIYAKYPGWKHTSTNDIPTNAPVSQ